MTDSVKKTFSQKVAAFLKIDDEGKIESFQKQSLKAIRKQIKTREDLLEEKQEEMKEYLNEKSPEVVLNINVESIKTIQGRKDYFKQTYLPNLIEVVEGKDQYEADIEKLETQIAQYKEIAELIS